MGAPDGFRKGDFPLLLSHALDDLPAVRCDRLTGVVQSNAIYPYPLRV